ncbi:MAG: hypothetical protein ACK4V6_18090 [Microthrixaceae bacterium]
MISVFFSAIPWALPGTVALSLVSVLVAVRLAARTGANAFLIWAFLSCAGGYLSVTTTPSTSGGFWGRSRTASLMVSLPSPRDLTSLTSESLNLWICVPLGFTALLLALNFRSWIPLAAAAGLPLMAEGTQWALPVLGRAGFLLSDAITNWIGVALGVGLALTVAMPFAAWSRQPGARAKQSTRGLVHEDREAAT